MDDILDENTVALKPVTVEEFKSWTEHLKGVHSPAQECFLTGSYYRAFWCHSSDAKILLDEHYNIIDTNTKFCDLVRCSRDDIIGKNIDDFLPTCRSEADLYSLDAVALGKVIANEKNTRLITPDDRILIPVRINAIRVPNQCDKDLDRIVVHISKLNTKAYDDNGKEINYRNSDGSFSKVNLLDDDEYKRKLKELEMKVNENKKIGVIERIINKPWFPWLFALLLILLAFAGKVEMILEKIF